MHSVLYHDIAKTNSHCFVKAKVIASLPTDSVMKQPDRDTWVCLAKVSGQVHSAGCTCEAG